MREDLAGSSGKRPMSERQREVVESCMAGARDTCERERLVQGNQDARTTYPPAAGVRSQA